jgi:hypothetical protein
VAQQSQQPSPRARGNNTDRAGCDQHRRCRPKQAGRLDPHGHSAERSWPSVGLVVAGDAAYHDVHLYLAESNAETRKQWIAALDKIETLEPRAEIARHKKAEKEDSPRIIEETRQYIRDFERLEEMKTTARELYDKMLELYPDRANPGSLWDSAKVVKP